ncbi:MAG: hypothetical protein NVSMB6_03960 [Burkholderiaceae bacterium]
MQTRFWSRQGISLLSAVVIVVGLLSIWFNDPARLATAFGLMSAGLAFALQQVVTAVAGYFVILRGSTFTVGDRISMGGVRGDVLQLGFIQTTILEMGQPPGVQSADPAMWVKSRQFTGRIVIVSNSKIFSEAVFNYSRNFPFIWEEIVIPVSYEANAAAAEAIMLAAAERYAVRADQAAEDSRNELAKRYNIEMPEIDARVYYRMTDNWLELSPRFVVHTHKIRDVKDTMSRFLVAELKTAGISIASATYDIVGLLPIEIKRQPRT